MAEPIPNPTPAPDPNPTSTPTPPAGAEPTPEPPAKSTEDAIKEAVAAAKAEWDKGLEKKLEDAKSEGARLAKLSAEQRKAEEDKLKSEAFEKEKAEFEREKLTMYAETELTKAKLRSRFYLLQSFFVLILCCDKVTAKIFRQTTICKCSTVFVMAGVVRLELTARGFGAAASGLDKTSDFK